MKQQVRMRAQETRRAYRELYMTAPGLGHYISGEQAEEDNPLKALVFATAACPLVPLALSNWLSALWSCWGATQSLQLAR